ncbi:hypothetical protein CMUS01_00452 [Colletotrichum musicola]|uniref:Uncharacterized protein n=1 Tax=Colletotrichum musicola TaxID=2175873 RepID=A0A8H6NYX0_9PEZI|nr:hypothetical protein CMUS01_00452 [Colletotrichum musicola]
MAGISHGRATTPARVSDRPPSATTSCCGIIQGEIPVWEVSVLWRLESGNWTEDCGAWTQERTAVCWYGYYVGKTANGPRLAILKPRLHESRPPSLHDWKEYDAPMLPWFGRPLRSSGLCSMAGENDVEMMTAATRRTVGGGTAGAIPDDENGLALW